MHPSSFVATRLKITSLSPSLHLHPLLETRAGGIHDWMTGVATLESETSVG
jgi:hypothetical protein